MTREELAAEREKQGLTPATFNYSDPISGMDKDPMWLAIWDEIKTWDINVPTEYTGHCGANGNHVTAIFKAVVGCQQKLVAEMLAKLPGLMAAKGQKLGL